MRATQRLLVAIVSLVLAGAVMAPPAQAKPPQSAPLVATSATTSSLTVTWPKTPGATRYEVDYSTRYDMAGAKTAKSGDNTATITGLKPGIFYCMQVRGYGSGGWGLRGPRHCKPTLLVPERSEASSVAVSVQTYNVCSRACEGNPKGGPWSQRQKHVIDRIMLAGTDVVALQETSTADSIISALGAKGYALAGQTKTEMLFYRTSKFTMGKAGNGQSSGTFTLSPAVTATWAALKEKSSGATYIFANAHLFHKGGASFDKQRREDTTELINGIRALNTGDLPVVYLGDWNSSLSHKLSPGGDDGPRTAFQAIGYADAYERSTRYRNPNLNSGNGFINPPRRSVRYGDHIDRIFIKNSSDPDVNVTSDYWWSVARFDGSNYATPWASDHNPVRASLLMPKPDVPLPSNATRLAGSDRYATAATISKALFSPGVEALFVANGLMFPDGLSGGPGAAKLNSPLLTIPGNRIPSGTIAEIKRLKPKKIYILGGTGAINSNVENSLEKLTTGDVDRLAGSNRYATSARAASLWSNADKVYVASGEMFPDALSGGAAAARDGAPLLLTKATRLPAEIAEALKRLKPSKIVIVGGTGAISDGVRAAIARAVPAAEIVRSAGKDRYATSAALISGSTATLMIASGAAFPDALAGVPASAATGSAFALSRSTCLPPSVRNKAPDASVDRYFVLGGKAVMANTVTRAC